MHIENWTWKIEFFTVSTRHSYLVWASRSAKQIKDDLTKSFSPKMGLMKFTTATGIGVACKQAIGQIWLMKGSENECDNPIIPLPGSSSWRRLRRLRWSWKSDHTAEESFLFNQATFISNVLAFDKSLSLVIVSSWRDLNFYPRPCLCFAGANVYTQTISAYNPVSKASNR